MGGGDGDVGFPRSPFSLSPMVGLAVFLFCALLLVAGYAVYGRLAERVYGVSHSMTMPCEQRADGVDYVRMPTWRVFLVQLLNIAGLGPVFGALAGCLYGPVALVWIVVGCILVGAVHDFLAAVMSAEHGGANMPYLVGRYLGGWSRHALRVVCVGLLLMVGVVFTVGPAGMLHALVDSVSVNMWCVFILLYYLLATILPINTIIGRIYPVFGGFFLFMVVGLAVALPAGDFPVLPDVNFMHNVHPQGLSVWPMIFVTIACGAVSGFHATQSPMMVRCLADARNMRPVFYGAMVTEGLVALVWAVVGLSLREIPTEYMLVGKTVVPLAEGARALTFGQLSLVSPATAVNVACSTLLGPVGAAFAVLGVVVLPITSGDTAMRSCRLILAEALHVRQQRVAGRLALALPLFAVVIVISQLDFGVIWRYFGWANQVLSCFTLWSIAVCLRLRGRLHWIATLPAAFMTAVCTAYLLESPDCGIVLPEVSGNIGACVVSAACISLLLVFRKPGTEAVAQE